MKLFVGLGNPGLRYRMTRHNVGFMCLDSLAAQEGTRFRKEKDREIASFGSGADKTYLLKPLTYMNLSGNPVRAMADYYSLAPDDIVVILDDVSLPLGSIRYRGKGSPGGHNGLAHIISQMGTDAVPRVRAGIGPQPFRVPLEAFVLSRFKRSEQVLLKEMSGRILHLCDCVREGYSSQRIMNEFNRKS